MPWKWGLWGRLSSAVCAQGPAAVQCTTEHLTQNKTAAENSRRRCRSWRGPQRLAEASSLEGGIFQNRTTSLSGKRVSPQGPSQWDEYLPGLCIGRQGFCVSEENQAYCPQRCLWLTDSKKECERENLCFWLVSSRAITGDLGCVAQGRLAGLRVFEHSVSDLGNYSKLNASSCNTYNSQEIHLEVTSPL